MLRTSVLNEIKFAFENNKAVALLGPRQCGKTTAARQYFKSEHGHNTQYFDLENLTDLERLKDPLLTLEPLEGLIVIDEVQRSPNLFQTLRVLCDDTNKQRQFLILGSASRELIQQSSESLAGRIHYIELTPFSFEETGELEKLWLQGGFPRSYLAKTGEHSVSWRQQYIKTFLEQDIPQLGINIPAQNMRRFWMMLAHYNTEIFNASAIGNSLDLSHNTIKKYFDILCGTFMTRELKPWHENIRKRQIKSSKIYFRDNGIFHSLINVKNKEELLVHPKLGDSWEAFALESIIRHLKADPNDCYFWMTQNKAELDLLIFDGLDKHGFEFKHSKSPKLTPSMKIATEDLKLKSLTVIYPGDTSFKLNDKVHCKGLINILNENL